MMSRHHSLVIKCYGTWGSTFVLHCCLDSNMYYVFDRSYECWLQRASLFRDHVLWEFIGMSYNEMKWFIVAYFEIAFKLLTLIYISRCQMDSEPLVHMNYTGTIFSYKPFCCDEEYEAFDFKTDWLKNLTKVYKLIPRELLFARKHHSISGHQNDSNPNLELFYAKHDTDIDKHGENLVLCNFLLHVVHITLKDQTM